MKQVSAMMMALLAVLVAFSTSHADYSQLVDRLGLNDYIDWASVVAAGSEQSPIYPTSNNGVGATVALEQNGTLYGLVQGTTWTGNFNDGENLLYNGGSFGRAGAIEVEFPSPIYGGGANIQAGGTFGSFTASVSAMGWSTETDSYYLLATFSITGNSNGNGDGSAPFIGIVSSQADIYALFFNAVGSNGDDFAINRLGFATDRVPVPAPLLLLCPGLIVLVIMRRRTGVARRGR